MLIKTFMLPVYSSETTENELNHFLKSHKIFHIEKKFVDNQSNSFWSVLVEYDIHNQSAESKNKKGKSKIDYREKLAPEVFEVFAKLQEIRKQIAIADGVAVYVVFSNEELESIALLKEITLENIKAIKGIAGKRVEKYAPALVEMYHKQKK